MRRTPDSFLARGLARASRARSSVACSSASALVALAGPSLAQGEAPASAAPDVDVFLVAFDGRPIGRAAFAREAAPEGVRTVSRWRLALGADEARAEWTATSSQEAGPGGLLVPAELHGRGEVRGRPWELALTFRGGRVRGEVGGERVLRSLPRPWATFGDLVRGAAGLGPGGELPLNLLHVWPRVTLVRDGLLAPAGTFEREGPWGLRRSGTRWELLGDGRRPVAALEVDETGTVLRAQHELFDRRLTLTRVAGEGAGFAREGPPVHAVLTGAEEGPAALLGPRTTGWTARASCAARFVALEERRGTGRADVEVEYYPTAVAGVGDDRLVVAGLEDGGATLLELWEVAPAEEAALLTRTSLYRGHDPGRARVGLLAQHLGRAGCVLAYSLSGRHVWSLDLDEAGAASARAPAPGERRTPQEEGWTVYARIGEAPVPRPPDVPGLAADHVAWLVGDHAAMGYVQVFVPTAAGAPTLLLVDANRDGVLDAARWVAAEEARAAQLHDAATLRHRVR